MLNKKAQASIQIFILIVAAFAVSFLVYESSDASAATISAPSVCCEKTTDGALCVNTDESSCNLDFKVSPTSCQSTPYCKWGTCYDSSEGFCMENTPQSVCQEQSGTWVDKEMEEVSQCQLGCCIIGDQAAFSTLVRCKRLSSLFGLEMDYRNDLNTEISCIAEAQSQDKGACVFEQDFQRTCTFTTKKDCNAQDTVQVTNDTDVLVSVDKTFYKDYLCSADELDTVCARQASTGCENGKVYWYDSCGNRENVYSGNKDKSWSNGRAVEPSEVCDANDGSNNECGNCDYLLGSRCSAWEGVFGLGKPEFADHFCESTTCVDENGDERKNGESWCVYDGSTGGGSDSVGSRHYKKVCVDGDVKVEACGDFRQQACIQGEIETDDGSFSTAACRQNRWQDCSAQEEKDDCENVDRRDCVWLPPASGLMINAGTSGEVFSASSSGDSFNSPLTGNAIFGDEGEDSGEDDDTHTNRAVGVCSPDIPPGLEFWKDGEARSTCGQATAKCVVKWEESEIGGKECIENCECLEEDWALHMNYICASMGDCGGYVNYDGKYTNDGYEWIQDGDKREITPNNVNKLRISALNQGEKSESFVWAVPAGLAGVGLTAGLFGEIGATSAVSILPEIAGTQIANVPTLNSITSVLHLNSNWIAAGAFNSLIIGGIVWGAASLLGADSNTASALGAATMAGLFAGEVAGVLALESSSAVAFAAGNPVVAGSWLSSAAPGATILVGGTPQSIGTGLYVTEAMAAQGITAGVGEINLGWLAANAGLINIGVAIGIGILVYYLIKKDEVLEVVTYTCMPWQAPIGGSGCEECNDDELACSEYRCRALGQNCELVNQGSDDEKCVDVNPRDTNPPTITPNKNDLTYGYNYLDESMYGVQIVRESGEGCVEAFEPLTFGIDTDEPAQCKIDISGERGFDEMTYWVGGKNFYLYNHTEQLSLPGFKEFGNGSIELINGKEMNLFVKCMDKKGNVNDADYNIRFCVDDTPDSTAPQIRATSIINEGCVAENTDNANVDFFLSEPSECKWSHDDQSYSNMQNEMSCSNKIEQINSFKLYTCSANLTGISRDLTDFHVRCKDQPGKPDNERNENRESYKFSLRGSTALKIDNLKPNGTIYGAVNPAPVILSVKTLFGCDAGKAICYYSTTGEDSDYLQFFETNTDDGFHTQRQDLLGGDHTYFYKCVDAGGNVAVDSTDFTLDIDTNAPVIARAYEENEMLKIVTVRDSECSYSFNNCDFLFEEGTEMPYPNSTVHVAEWKEDRTYYVKCRDEFKTEEADCSLVIRPTDNFL
jgi:hypothetical protein